MNDETDRDEALWAPLTDAEVACMRSPRGCTLDSGRVHVDDVIAGDGYTGLWSGWQLEPRRRPVFISYEVRDYVTYREHCDYWFRYEAPGIAPLVFFGYLDGVTPPDAWVIRRMMRFGARPCMAVVEARPEGERLSAVEPLNLAEVIRLGLGLCDTLLGLDGRQIIGLRHETVFIAGERGNRYYAGATPRSFQMLGNDGMGTVFSAECFDPPTQSFFDRDADELVYTVGLLLWYALLRSHAFYVGPPSDVYQNMWNDVRAPFTGPPELGRLLEAVLVADVAKRMKAPELREGLARLAARWNVEPPPFPPPGLA